MILWTSWERENTRQTLTWKWTVKTTNCQRTFPLISCSTMFSGLRSLCMILFSCRYWIPEPGAESTRFYRMLTLWDTRLTWRRETLDVPTSLSKESTSLSFKPQQFSGLLNIWNPRKHNSLYVHWLNTRLQYSNTTQKYLQQWCVLLYTSVCWKLTTVLVFITARG